MQHACRAPSRSIRGITTESQLTHSQWKCCKFASKINFDYSLKLTGHHQHWPAGHWVQSLWEKHYSRTQHAGYARERLPKSAHSQCIYSNHIIFYIFLASVDSASLMVSEVADHDQTCSSEDLCSLEVQGSDSSPYGLLQTAPNGGSCTSLELCMRASSRCHRGMPNTDSRPSDTGYSESSHTQDSLERSPDWSSENFSNLDQEDSAENPHPCEEFRAAMHISDELASAKHLPEDPPKAATHSLIKARMMSRKLTLPVAIPPPPQPCSPTSVASSGGTSAISPSAPSLSPSPPTRPRGPRLCFSVWSPSPTSQPPSTSGQSGQSPSEKPRTLRAARRYRKLARIVRSTSDPISCSTTTGSTSNT